MFIVFPDMFSIVQSLELKQSHPGCVVETQKCNFPFSSPGSGQLHWSCQVRGTAGGRTGGAGVKAEETGGLKVEAEETKGAGVEVEGTGRAGVESEGMEEQ